MTRHWSGKHGRVVQGINLMTLLWTEGDRHIPRLLSVLRKVSGWSHEKGPFSLDARNRARKVAWRPNV